MFIAKGIEFFLNSLIPLGPVWVFASSAESWVGGSARDTFGRANADVGDVEPVKGLEMGVHRRGDDLGCRGRRYERRKRGECGRARW